MSTTFQTPLRPKPGARATRVTPQPERERQPVTNREWQEQRRKARQSGILSRILEKVLP